MNRACENERREVIEQLSKIQAELRTFCEEEFEYMSQMARIKSLNSSYAHCEEIIAALQELLDKMERTIDKAENAE